MTRVVHIVPGFAPRIDAVGDYARQLASGLAQRGGIESEFLVGDPFWIGANGMRPIGAVGARSASSLRESLEASGAERVLLHYSNYGYAKRGCAIWLLRGLERWLAADGRRRLFTMYHELYARGRIDTSAFWLSRLQRGIAARLARLSAACLTSCSANARELEALSRGKHSRIGSLPVLSTIGEPESVAGPAGRGRMLVVFGTAPRRELAYNCGEIGAIMQRLGAEKLIDIGPPLLRYPEGLPIDRLGELPEARISQELSGSLAGLLHYPAHLLPKSSVYAAYSAHGLATVLLGSAAPGAPADGLAPGRHYLLAQDEIRADSASACAAAALEWYRAHDLQSQAAAFAALIEGNDN